jgi:hypothetical protein
VHYFETLVFSDSGLVRARVTSLTQSPFGPLVDWTKVLTEVGLEPQGPFFATRDDLAASLLDMAQGFEGPGWEWNEFVDQLFYGDIITVEQSPGIVANLGTLMATGAGGFLVGGTDGVLLGVVIAAPTLVVVSVVKGVATGAERAAEKVAEEVVEAWLRRVLRRPQDPAEKPPS